MKLEECARLIVEIFRFHDAPEYLQALSRHGGDEDWLALVPRSLARDAPKDWPRPGDDDAAYQLPGWMWPGTAFGWYCVSVQPHPVRTDRVVVIGAHA